MRSTLLPILLTASLSAAAGCAASDPVTHEDDGGNESDHGGRPGSDAEDGALLGDTESPDSGENADTSPIDTAPPDTSPVDAAPPDTSPIDAAPLDTSPVDAAPLDTSPIDAAPPDTSPIDAAPLDTSPVDAAPLDTSPVDAAPLDISPIDTAPSDASPVDAAPPPTPGRGSYLYARLPIGGLREARAVAFHPTDDYFVVPESTNIVHVWDVATRADTRLDLTPARGNLYWETIAFSPDGAFALLGGSIVDGSTKTGVLYRFEDAGWRAYAGTVSSVLAPVEGAPAVNAYAAVEWPAGGGSPAILTRNELGGGAYTFVLRRWDPTTGAFSYIGAQSSSAGCQDLSWADNEFGEPGVFVTCGINGYDAWYWTTIGGVGEWRHGTQLGNTNLGNSAHVASHPREGYALVVSWSGRAIYRFEAGLLNGYSDAPRFSTLELWNIAFQPDGRRALAVGGAGGSPMTGTVLEYRHDEYACSSPSSPSCGWTNVSIVGFGGAPYNATSNANLNDAAWRHDCDGGVIVGGESNFSGSTGLAITFEVEGGVDCW